MPTVLCFQNFRDFIVFPKLLFHFLFCKDFSIFLSSLFYLKILFSLWSAPYHKIQCIFHNVIVNLPVCNILSLLLSSFSSLSLKLQFIVSNLTKKILQYLRVPTLHTCSLDNSDYCYGWLFSTLCCSWHTFSLAYQLSINSLSSHPILFQRHVFSQQLLPPVRFLCLKPKSHFNSP